MRASMGYIKQLIQQTVHKALGIYKRDEKMLEAMHIYLQATNCIF